MSSPSNKPSSVRRRRRTWCAALILLASAALATSATAETNVEHIDHLLDTCTSFDGQVKTELAIARLDLDAVREADGWQPGQKETAQAWLDTLERTGVYTTNETPLSPNSSTVHFRSIAPHHLQPPASQWGDAVAERLRNLESTRRKVVSDLSTALFEFADPIWASAMTPADLQPAIQPLLRFKRDVLSKLPDVALSKVHAPFPNPSFLSNGTRLVSEGERIRGLALFILSPEPLIFPDPEQDPAEYIRLRQIWADIGVWNLECVSFSHMITTVNENDRRLKRAAYAARRNLDRLILQAASPAEISKAMDAFQIFCIAAPPPPVIPSRSAPFTPQQKQSRPTLPSSARGKMPANESLIEDYRDLQKFSPTPGSNGTPYIPELRPAIDPALFDAYRAMVDLIVAQASPMPPDLAPLRDTVGKKLRQLDPQLQAAVAPLLQPASSRADLPVAPATPGHDTPPMVTLVKLLESATSSQNGSRAAKTILSAWQIQEPLLDSHPEIISASHDAEWSDLAGRPQGFAIFAARDAASRQLLRKICGTESDAALPAIVREQLDKAIAAADWNRYGKLLAVDQLMTILPTDEHREWSEILTAFELANKAAEEKQIAQAQWTYRQILSHAPASAAAGETVARLLKALPHP